MLPVIEPIRPLLAKSLPLGREWRYELKLDGFRATFYVEEDRAWFRSKSKLVMRRFQPLADQLRPVLRATSAILDGEIIVVGQNVPQFNALMFRRGREEYAAFDLLWWRGRDLRHMPYSKRKAKLRQVLDAGDAIAYVEGHREPELLEEAICRDLEGVVAKRVGDPYTPETLWVKVRNRSYSQMDGRHELFDRSRRRSR